METVLTSEQVRKARALLGWSRVQLGSRCGMSDSVVAKFENTGRIVPARFSTPAEPDRLQALRTVLEAAGIDFGQGEPEVRLRLDLSIEPAHIDHSQSLIATAIG